MFTNVFKKKTNHLSRNSTEGDFERILRDWTDLCNAQKLSIPSKAINEITKRIDSCTAKGKSISDEGNGKAKLNFSNCKLTDDHIVTLFQSMEFSPVIAKMDISQNYLSNRSARFALDFLHVQTALLENSTDRETRLNFNFLSDLILLPILPSDMNANGKIDDIVLNDLNSALSVLKRANAQSHIYQTYKSLGSPPQLDEAQLHTLCVNSSNTIMSTKSSKKLVVDTIMNGQRMISYEEAESGLLSMLLKEVEGSTASNKNASTRVLKRSSNNNVRDLTNSNSNSYDTEELPQSQRLVRQSSFTSTLMSSFSKKKEASSSSSPSSSSSSFLKSSIRSSSESSSSRNSPQQSSLPSPLRLKSSLDDASTSSAAPETPASPTTPVNPARQLARSLSSWRILRSSGDSNHSHHSMAMSPPNSLFRDWIALTRKRRAGAKAAPWSSAQILLAVTSASQFAAIPLRSAFPWNLMERSCR